MRGEKIYLEHSPTELLGKCLLSLLRYFVLWHLVVCCMDRDASQERAASVFRTDEDGVCLRNIGRQNRRTIHRKNKSLQDPDVVIVLYNTCTVVKNNENCGPGGLNVVTI